jgi:amino acid adenylation domain-containing protein/non-ribosomal peptide synthase protein (TIGR01720 family)
MAEQVYVFPTSFAQQRLWFLDQLVPGSSLYNVDVAIPVSRQINVSILEASVNEVVRRHESLRTTFKSVNGEPFQVIASSLHIPLSLIDLSPLPDAARSARATELATEQAQQPFDLARGPLLRTTLAQLGEAEFIFLLTLHHIVCDGWSVGVFFEELTAIYEAFAVGAPSPLPELAVQYADFAVSQREWLQGPEAEAHLDFWKKQLAHLPVLHLPADRPRPSDLTYMGARHTFAIPEDLQAALRDLSQQERVTMFMSLLAAFQVLLHRYTGQDDIVIGTPVANRNHTGIEDLIGFFVNPIVLHTKLSGGPTFREMLARVRKVALEAFDHQDLPFEKLVHELQPERDLAVNPLFQVTFQLFSPVGGVLPQEDGQERALFDRTPLQVESGTANIDFALDMWDLPEGISGRIEYSTEQFDASTIAGMAENFSNLLAGIVAQPDLPISEYSMLSETERRRILVQWNDTAAPFPQDVCLHGLFEAQVERTPDDIALVFRNQALSYRELNQRADSLAAYLRTAGVGPEVIVAICVERCFELVVGLLGILKAGGAYLPMDPSNPKSRLAFFLEDAKPKVLLTQARLRDALPFFPGRTICLDQDWDLIAAIAEPDSAAPVNARNLCYLIYTSGSLGKPKGVMVEHRSVSNHLLWMQEAFPLTPGDRIPQKYSISFDASVCEIFGPLIAGARLIVAEQGGHLDIPQLVTLLVDHQITVIDLVPSLLQVLLEDPRFLTCGSVRRVTCGGEPLPIQVQESCLARMRAQLNNIYGPTECTIGVAAWTCRQGYSSRIVPIGRPIANTRIYLLDPHLNPVPAGVPGELHVAGDSVARGYLNQPALTAERFIPDPFSSHPGARLYKTGDLARYLPDGNLEYLGRIDHQLKIRGYRVELGEIETTLQEHSSVRRCAVTLHQDDSGPARLVAYVVPEEVQYAASGSLSLATPSQALAVSAGASTATGVEGSGGTYSSQPQSKQTSGDLVATLRSFLRETLPEYMLPSSFVLMKQLPLTSAGKVDRAALVAPAETKPEVAEVEHPVGKVESLLLKIWTQLLGVEKIGLRDNFFELGGDSILSIQVVARANQAGLHFTPAQLFQHQTIAELAAVAETTPFLQPDQAPSTGRVALTPVQKWFFEQDLPDPHHYNQSILFRVPRSLEAGKIAAVLRHLLSHHDALRLRFQRDGSGWQQIIAPPGEEAPLLVRDLSGLSETEQRAQIEETGADLQSSLSLAEGPMLQAALFRRGGRRDDRLLLVLHHLVVDGVSWRILLEDFETAYGQLASGDDISLPPRTTSFQYWAERLQQYAQSAVLAQETGYWLQLSRAQAAPLPQDRAGANRVASARSVMVSLNAPQTRELIQEVPKTYHAHINELLLAALVHAFRGWTGNKSLLLDLEGHGREGLFPEVDVTRTVGWFTSIFPVHLDLEDATDSQSVLKAVKNQLRRIPHGGVGYGLLRYLRAEEEIVRSLRALPRPEVAFNYLGQFGQEAAGPGAWKTAVESIGPSASPRAARPYLIEINGSVDDGRLQMDWSYSQEIHERSTIEKLARSFMDALESFIIDRSATKAPGFTPADFSKARLSQRDLDKLIARLQVSSGT